MFSHYLANQYAESTKQKRSRKLLLFFFTRESNEVQGLIGLRNDKVMNAAYIYWVCVAPQNNFHDTGRKKYIGVGGHLFAIAVDKSFKWGYSGDVYGFASCRELPPGYLEGNIEKVSQIRSNVDQRAFVRYIMEKQISPLDVSWEEIKQFLINPEIDNVWY